LPLPMSWIKAPAIVNGRWEWITHQFRNGMFVSGKIYWACQMSGEWYCITMWCGESNFFMFKRFRVRICWVYVVNPLCWYLDCILLRVIFGKQLYARFYCSFLIFFHKKTRTSQMYYPWAGIITIIYFVNVR
jgi:hypothetical protein